MSNEGGTTPVTLPLQINEKWTMGEPIQRAMWKHAVVYAVLNLESGQPEKDLEAHVFILDRTQPWLRKHRLRCIKRMRKHTKLELKTQEDTIIVIIESQGTNTEAAGEDRTSSPSSSSTDMQLGNEEPHKAAVKNEQKTPYQRESARIRQKERRQAKRRRKTEHQQAKTVNSEHEQVVLSDEVQLDSAETEFSTYLVLLWILYDETGTRRVRIEEPLSSVLNDSASFFGNVANYRGSDSLLETVEDYLNQKPSKALSPADMISYLKIKRTEIISLRRVQARIPGAEKYHESKILELEGEKSENQGEIIISKKIEPDDDPELESEFQLKLLRQAKAVLPKALATRKSLVRAMERKLARAREKLASKELQDQRDRLVHKVSEYRVWMSTVFPLSEAREHLIKEWESAKNELAALDQKHPKAANPPNVQCEQQINQNNRAR